MPSVLITGCSDGGMGAALALEFHRIGWHVYATARDTNKMTSLRDTNVEFIQLDISSDASIAECAKRVPSLDMLINNAGALYVMPISDLTIAEAKTIFDANLWGHLTITNALLPQLRRSERPVVVNHTSVGADLAIPFQGVYNASKAAMAMMSDTMRLELSAFNIAVVNLKTAAVKTNVIKNSAARKLQLPAGSVWEPAKEQVEEMLTAAWAADQGGISAEQWAKEVCRDLQKQPPPLEIWRGQSAWLIRLLGFFPAGFADSIIKKTTGFSQIEAFFRKA